MGNPDLVIIINKQAYIIKGTKYVDISQAIRQALLRFEEYLGVIEMERHDTKTGELHPDADPNYVPEEIKVIRVYEIN